MISNLGKSSIFHVKANNDVRYHNEVFAGETTLNIQDKTKKHGKKFSFRVQRLLTLDVLSMFVYLSGSDFGRSMPSILIKANKCSGYQTI